MSPEIRRTDRGDGSESVVSFERAFERLGDTTDESASELLAALEAGQIRSNNFAVYDIPQPCQRCGSTSRPVGQSCLCFDNGSQ